MSDAALLSRLRQICGPGHVLTHEGIDTSADTEARLHVHETDSRGRMQGRALALVQPTHTQEVAAVVQACAAHGASIVPQGGNTGLVLGSIPDGSGRQILLSLARMNRVRQIDSANLTLTAEAGCILQNVQQAASDAGLLFPLSMASEGSCTLGGNLATNAGGTQVLRYGNARELCLGLEVVTAQGEIWHGLSGLRKDNTGYDLRHLMIGSEGTLGIITAACMKLYPKPQSELSAWLAVPTLHAAVALLERARTQLDAALTGFEVMNAFALDLTLRQFPDLRRPLPNASGYSVLLQLASAEAEAVLMERVEALLGAALEAQLITDAALARTDSQAQALWHIRECIPLAQAREGLNVKHDISLPISQIPAFCAHTDALLQKQFAGVRLVNFGHLGDGNLHYNVQAPEGTDSQAFLAQHEAPIHNCVYEAVAQFGGSFSAEHGIGRLKTAHLAHYKDPVAQSLMRRIKEALDPEHRLNPGVVLSSPPAA